MSRTEQGKKVSEEASDQAADLIDGLIAPGAPFEMIERELRGQRVQAFKNLPRTIRDIYDDANARFADREFLIYEGRRLSYRDTLGLAASLSKSLVERFGIERGDRVAIAMRNCPEWMIAFIAITGAGAIAVPLNSWGTGEEMAYCLQDSQCKLVFADPDRHSRIKSIENMNDLVVIAAKSSSGDELPAEVPDIADLMSSEAEVTWPEGSTDSADDVLILYTSGTTGHPKGVLSDHMSLLSGLMSMQFSIAMATARAEAMMKQVDPDFKMPTDFQMASVLAFPLFHISGCMSLFLFNMIIGGKIAVMYKWDVNVALDLIESERITSFNGVATMLSDLVSAACDQERDLSSLMSIGGGGAAVPPSLINTWREVCPSVVPGTGYGLTESGGTVASIVGEDYQANRHSVGRILPFASVKIFDEDGREMEQGDSGEICIQSAMTMKGYWGKPEETAETFRGSWLRTGDVGYLDDRGYLYISDRIKDMVICGGENIYCAEVEKVLHEHIGVREGAAFGLPDERLGEILAVAIICEPGVSLCEEDITSHVGDHLARFKVPRKVIFRAAPLERNISGKIKKKELREEVMKEFGLA